MSSEYEETYKKWSFGKLLNTSEMLTFLLIHYLCYYFSISLAGIAFYDNYLLPGS